jgi:NADH:ubiquinone oxidoreductase subunit 6 (subunit J)
MTLELAVFYFCAGLAAVAAFFLLIEARTPLSASLAFSALGLAVAGIMQGLAADFLAVAQWILSLGAALVLFVSSLMVSGVAGERLGTPSPLRVVAKLSGAVAAAALVGLLLSVVSASRTAPTPSPASPGAASVGESLFGADAVPLHLLGLLLLVVLVGSVVLGKRRLD